jgi:hypothetical protein
MRSRYWQPAPQSDWETRGPEQGVSGGWGCLGHRRDRDRTENYLAGQSLNQASRMSFHNLPLMIFENLQSAFEHAQSLLVVGYRMSVRLQSSDPFALLSNNSAPFGYVPSGHRQVGFRFVGHSKTIAR